MPKQPRWIFLTYLNSVNIFAGIYCLMGEFFRRCCVAIRWLCVPDDLILHLPLYTLYLLNFTLHLQIKTLHFSIYTLHLNCKLKALHVTLLPSGSTIAAVAKGHPLLMNQAGLGLAHCTALLQSPFNRFCE